MNQMQMPIDVSVHRGVMFGCSLYLKDFGPFNIRMDDTFILSYVDA